MEWQKQKLNLNQKYYFLPLKPLVKSDQHPISPSNNTAWSNIQVMRLKEMIT